MSDAVIPDHYRLVLHRFDGSITTGDLANHARYPYRVGDELAERCEGKWRVTEIDTLADGRPVLICEQTY